MIYVNPFKGDDNMKTESRYTIQQSQMYLDFSINPVVKIKVSDDRTGLTCTGYGEDVEKATENAFTNLKIKEEKVFGKYFNIYDAKGKTISGQHLNHNVNQKV